MFYTDGKLRYPVASPRHDALRRCEQSQKNQEGMVKMIFIPEVRR